MKDEILFYNNVMKNGNSKGEINTFKKKIKYIVRKQRLSLVSDIKEYFLKLYYEENNKLPITAIFAKELSETQREQLIKKLENKYGKKIVLNLKVDKEIIGGGILKIGNEVINGSIKNQIEEIKKNF